MPSVLIVDDDPFIRKLIATTLEDVAGFELAEAGDGAEAVAVAAREAPEMVFLDIDMPELDGLEVCRRLRAAPEHRLRHDRDPHRRRRRCRRARGRGGGRRPVPDQALQPARAAAPGARPRGRLTATRVRGYLGLGSNEGDRLAALRAARDALGRRGIEVVASSSAYETAPQGEVLDQPDFLNACVAIDTGLVARGAAGRVQGR